MRAVLYVDDREEELQSLRFQLSSAYRVMTCRRGETAATLVKVRKPDAVVLDIEMPGYDGFRVLSDIRALPDPPPVLMLSAHPEPFFVVRAMKEGATDFLAKPYTAAMVRRFLDRMLMSGGASAAPALSPCRFLVGSSQLMTETRGLLAAYARSELPVLILGESGTGKELAARTIHALSSRAMGPFEAVNVGALPDSIAESELFGCEEGAFTDARSRAGRFEAAHGGTLFLDEIGDAGAVVQAALLRVVEDGLVRRLGGTKSRKVDCRLIFATNKDIGDADDGRCGFRGDLLYRISTLSIVMPPLRKRPEDIPELVRHFLSSGGAPGPDIEPEALEYLGTRDWPGNVRQLKACIERALVLSSGGSIGVRHLRA